MIKRRTTVKDPSGDHAYYPPVLPEIEVSKDEKLPSVETRSDEANKAQAISVPGKVQYELQQKDEEIWKLNKRIEDLEKALVHSEVAEETASQMKQNHEAHTYEKYEKDLKDAKAREQKYARNAAIFAKELKQEKLKHAKTLEKLEETEQKIMLIEQMKEPSVIVDADRKNDSTKSQKEPSVVVDADRKDDSAKSQLYTDEDIKRMKRRIQELEQSSADLNQRLEEAEIHLKVNDGFTRPEHKTPDGLNRCHDIFICPNESGYEKLEEKLAHRNSKFIHAVAVHGRPVEERLKETIKVRRPKYIPPQARKKDRFSPKDFRRLTPLGKIILLGIIEDIYRLHRRGFCLDGRFTLESFYWTDEKKVKLDPCLKLIAASSERRKSCMINDYHRIHEVIMQILSLCKETASEDLEQLLNLLKCDDPVEVQDIIRYNISLMTEIGKRGHFITLYDRWKQMLAQEEKMKEDKGKPIEDEGSETKIPNSERVLQFIPTSIRNSDGSKEDWSNLVDQNDHVKEIYHRRCRLTGKNKLYGAKEVLQVWRNALTHVLDDSLAEEKIEFFDEDVVNMLELVLPGVFNLFQKGMHSVGHEELPHLIRTMRM